MSETRPRSKSTFSFRSNKSDKSAGKQKLDLTETDAEKRAGKMSAKTKANPNRAVNEAQPIAVAQAAMTMKPMRSTSYKDASGNIIEDPDWSNPSRPRLERPLDTIRSFEAAIDNSHAKRFNAIRPETAQEGPNNIASRRSSYHSDFPQSQRYSPAGGYGSRVGSSYRGQEGYNSHSYHGSSSPGYPQQRRVHSQRSYQNNNRMSSDYGVYNNQTYLDSYDTVQTGESSGSQSTDMYGNSTDPSSENSSIDRTHPMASKTDGDAYAGGVGRRSPMHAAIMEEYGGQYEQQGHVGGNPSPYGGPPAQQQYPQERLSAAPTTAMAPPQPRPVIKLGGDSAATGGSPKYYEPPSRTKEKKGFFKKRFGKD